MPKQSIAFDLHRVLETLLFLAGKPLRIKKIAELLGMDAATARTAVEAFRTTWNARDGGTVVATVGDEVQMVTHADLHEIAETYAKDETRGELTRPQLEALTVIAYRGPVTKAELEQIRGVHCGLILRNLLIRGLVEQRMDTTRHEEVFTISMDFLRHLGLTDARELPDFDRLHGSEVVTQYLAHAMGDTEEQVASAPPV